MEVGAWAKNKINKKRRPRILECSKMKLKHSPREQSSTPLSYSIVCKDQKLKLETEIFIVLRNQKKGPKRRKEKVRSPVPNTKDVRVLYF